ncbi:hypothetical protein, unknown function [Leishmania tarentolae]|uniref:Flagellar attachment zone protein 1 conserved domain-containing protein n=1 Tax=Leishmania tarentolae TaxID=5689 RepID=A0A640KQ25_LEITA|nr:hypothetical protein, unknown function [Leishmania tarentolae]
MRHADGADSICLHSGNLACLDVSQASRSPTSSRQSFPRNCGDSLSGPRDSYTCVSNGVNHRTSHSNTTSACLSQLQSFSSRVSTRLEGAMEQGTVRDPISAYPCPPPTAETRSSATRRVDVLHLPSAHCRVGASPFDTGSGVWVRADYLPRSCRASSAAAPPESLAHLNDGSRATAITSAPFAGGGVAIKPSRQSVRARNCNGVTNVHAHRSVGTTTRCVARSLRGASSTRSTQRPFSAPSAMPAPARGRREGMSSAAYTTNPYVIKGDGCEGLLPPSASHSSAASDSRSQKATQHEPRTSAPVAASIHVLDCYSPEDEVVARRSAAATNGSDLASSAEVQRGRPYLPVSSSVMHKRVSTTPLEQEDRDYITASTTPADSTWWPADPPSTSASVRSGVTDVDPLIGKGGPAFIAGSSERPRAYKVPSTVARQDPHSSEADTAEDDVYEGASTWWTVDIVINSLPYYGDSAFEEATTMRAAALLWSPADMRTLRSVQCRAPVLPADVSADEAWDMTQSFLRCIALTSVGASSPPCVPQDYFCFNTDFNEYVQLSADTLPMASTLFSVVMVPSSIDTCITQEDRAGCAEASDAMTGEAQKVSVPSLYPATYNHHLSTGASLASNHDDDAPQHHRSRVTERGVSAVIPRPPTARRTSAARHTLYHSLQPPRWENKTPSPLPPQLSATAGGPSRHRLAFDGNTSSHQHPTPVEELSPQPQRPRRFYESAVMSRGVRGNYGPAGVILTCNGDAGEEDSYLMSTYSVGGDAGAAVYGSRSPAPPTLYKGGAYGHYVDSGYAAEEERDAVADSRYRNDAMGCTDGNGEATPHAGAEDAMEDNWIRTPRATERQLRMSCGSSSNNGNPQGSSRLRCFHNTQAPSRPLIQRLPGSPTANSFPGPSESDSKASSQRPPTAPIQGDNHAGVVEVMQVPSSPSLSAALLQPLSHQLLFDDPMLQRHFESVCTQSPASLQSATGSTEGASGGRCRTYAPSPPLPPTPPAHSAYRPGLHPYFDPSPPTVSSVPGLASTPPFSADDTESSLVMISRAHRDALNALLQKSAQSRQQTHGSQMPCGQSPAPTSSGDMAVSVAPSPVTATRPQASRAVIDLAVDSTAAAKVSGASTPYLHGVFLINSRSRPLPLSATDVAVPRAAVEPPATSVEKDRASPRSHNYLLPPKKEEHSPTTTAEVDVPREIDANASASTNALAAAITALPESCANAVETRPKDDQHNREEAKRNHSRVTAPIVGGGESGKEATAVMMAAAAVEESRKRSGGGGDALGYFTDVQTTPMPATGSSAPALAVYEGGALAAGVEVSKESTWTPPADIGKELPASAAGGEEFDSPSAVESIALKENKDDRSHSRNRAAAPDAYPVEAGGTDTISTATTMTACHAAYKVVGDAPEQTTLSQEAPDRATRTPPAEYPTEAPQSQGDGDAAAGTEAPDESARNTESATEVVDIAAPSSAISGDARIVTARSLGRTPVSDSAAEPVDTEQLNRQREEADCTLEEGTHDTKVYAPRLQARSYADGAALLLSKKQSSSVTKATVMYAEDKHEEDEDANLACSAKPALEASSEMHGDENGVVLDDGIDVASPLQLDFSAGRSAATGNHGSKAPSEAETSVAEQQKGASDAPASPRALSSVNADELANAVTVDMLSKASAEVEKGSFSAMKDAKTVAPQLDVAAIAAPTARGGDSTPLSMIAAAKFLPAPVISVATQREKEEDPDAPPQVLHHRAAAAAVAAAANAFYSLWEESVTEDGMGDGDDAGVADHADTTAMRGNEEKRSPKRRSATSEAAATTTITASDDDIEGEVDVPMDVFRDSLSLTNTPTLIRRGEGREENTSAAATASLADPIDMLARTMGSDMCLLPASRAAALAANPNACVASTDVLAHLHCKAAPFEAPITAPRGGVAVPSEGGFGAATFGYNVGNEAPVFPDAAVQRRKAPSDVTPLSSPACAPSSSVWLQPIASPNDSLAQANMNPSEDGTQFLSAWREAQVPSRAVNDEPHTEPQSNATTQVKGPVLPLCEVSGDVGGDDAATLKKSMATAALGVDAADAPHPLPSMPWPFALTLQTTTHTMPLPPSSSQRLSLPTPLLPPSPPLSEGATKKTMVLLGFPGSAWEFIMTHHYEGMHDAFTRDSAVAARVPISAIQDVRYSKGSLMVDLYVLHPASVSENFIRDQMSSYSYPTLWAFYEVKKRERKKFLHGQGMSAAGGAVPASCLPQPLTATLSSQEKVSRTAS